MGTYCAPFFTELFLHFYETDLCDGLLKKKMEASLLLSCSAIKDDVLSINNKKIEKASEMQQPSCKLNSFGQTGFLFSRFINVMCQVSIFCHCWFTIKRFLNIKIINHFRPPLGPFFGPQTYRT
jgi:hypothetical protein